MYNVFIVLLRFSIYVKPRSPNKVLEDNILYNFLQVVTKTILSFILYIKA